jgi:diadenosine tetraphosphate (Ap4A) HIT family hydrolase
VLDRLWAGWRGEYVATVDDGPKDECVFCRILASGLPDNETYVVHRTDTVAVLLNAYPYTSGHVLVMPTRHLSELEDLTADESAAVWAAVTDAVVALKAAYQPEGTNVGINLGRAAGAGVPGHFHVHALPRWAGDSSFMTSVAEARVLPEALPTTWEKLTAAWPSRG